MARNVRMSPITLAHMIQRDAGVAANKAGELIMDIEGNEQDIAKAIEFTTHEGIEFRVLKSGITLDGECCVYCGAGTSICPSGALTLRRNDWSLVFAPEKCYACEPVGDALTKYSREVIVENWGDIFLTSAQPRKIGIYAGQSPLSQKVALMVVPDQTPVGVCTSSGTEGVLGSVIIIGDKLAAWGDIRLVQMRPSKNILAIDFKCINTTIQQSR